MPVLDTLAGADAVISNFHKLHLSACPDLVYSQTDFSMKCLKSKYFGKEDSTGSVCGVIFLRNRMNRVKVICRCMENILQNGRELGIKSQGELGSEMTHS